MLTDSHYCILTAQVRFQGSLLPEPFVMHAPGYNDFQRLVNQFSITAFLLEPLRAEPADKATNTQEV